MKIVTMCVDRSNMGKTKHELIAENIKSAEDAKIMCDALNMALIEHQRKIKIRPSMQDYLTDFRYCVVADHFTF